MENNEIDLFIVKEYNSLWQMLINICKMKQFYFLFLFFSYFISLISIVMDKMS